MATPTPAPKLPPTMAPEGPLSDPDLAPGMTIGEYRIDAVLGEGGMGVVLGATHLVINKRAAIKVLRGALCADPGLVARFIQEARSVNTIGHPNIVDIFDFGTLPDGRRYLIMEWLEGESLALRLRRQPLTPAEVVSILDQVVDALAAAHEARVVHRDLKPDNIFLAKRRNEAPRVKLLDFGIAKLDDANQPLAHTRTGSLMGTPGYLSPEQARGLEVDGRTDIYALGCLAFEMLAGRLPFVADSAADMIAAHLATPPPHLRSLRPSLPAELDALLYAMMAKRAADRPSLHTVRETLLGLRGTVASIGNQTIVGRAATPTPDTTIPDTTGAALRQHRWPLLIGSGVVVALAAAIVVLVTRGSAPTPTAPPPPPPQRTIEVGAAPTPPTPVPVAVPVADVADAGVPDAARGTDVGELVIEATPPKRKPPGKRVPKPRDPGSPDKPPSDQPVGDGLMLTP